MELKNISRAQKKRMQGKGGYIGKERVEGDVLIISGFVFCDTVLPVNTLTIQLSFLLCCSRILALYVFRFEHNSL